MAVDMPGQIASSRHSRTPDGRKAPCFTPGPAFAEAKIVTRAIQCGLAAPGWLRVASQWRSGEDRFQITMSKSLRAGPRLASSQYLTPRRRESPTKWNKRRISSRRAAARPPHPAPSDRAAPAPPARSRPPARRPGRPASAHRRSPPGASSGICSGLASRNCASPDCRVPSISPRAAKPQILLGDPEAVIGLPHQGEPRARRLAEGIAAQQQADRVPLAPPDPAAQLVELGQAEAVGALDDHQGRVGNVDSRPR